MMNDDDDIAHPVHKQYIRYIRRFVGAKIYCEEQGRIEDLALGAGWEPKARQYRGAASWFRKLSWLQ